MKHFVKKIILVLNILAAFALISAYISAFVSPASFWPLAFFGLMFPFILIINILFVLFWAIFRKYLFLISLICILAGFPFLRRIIQISIPLHSKAYYASKYQTGNTSFKFLTYNVRQFNLYKWEKKIDAEKSIFNFIDEETPDIICFQDFYTRDGSDVSQQKIMEYLKRTPYYHIAYSVEKKKNHSHFGIAIFSKFPILNQGEIKFPKSFNLCIYSDLKIGNDTIRVYNNHLQSIRFLKEDIDFIDTLKLKYNEQQLLGIRRIVRRVRSAFEKRSRQVDAVAAHIKKSPHPVIVCGDFNDSPVSYSYQKMKGKLKDAYIESGNGIGYTYRGKLRTYRIDYILFDKLLKSFDYQCPKVDYSDHYPVLTRFNLP